jgi:hypothetical protein
MATHRGARRIKKTGLREKYKRPFGNLISPGFPLGAGNLGQRAAKMNCPRMVAMRRYPRNGTPKRPIHFEHTGTVLVSCKRATVGRRKTLTCNLQESTRRQVAENDPRRRQIL